MLKENRDNLTPYSWHKRKKKKGEIDIFYEITKNFTDNQTIASFIKEDKKLEIKKNDLKNICLNLSNKIRNKVKNKKKQLKIFSPISASEESFILMATSAFLGAHHCIVFEDISDEAIFMRIKIFEPDIVIVRDSQKKISENLIKFCNSNKIEIFFIDLNFFKNSQTYLEVKNNSSYSEADNLFTLFTSGSTGKPKAIIHSAKSYFEYIKWTIKHFFRISKGKVFFCATDAGWINGHSYAFYGPLSVGAKTIIVENFNQISNAFFLLKLIRELKITCFYSSVTLLRVLKSNHNKEEEAISNNSLERIGSCGEPLADEVGRWAIKFFKPACKIIVNTYFQTETGGILVAPIENDGLPSSYSSVGKPDQNSGIVLSKQIYNDKQLKEQNLDPDEILIRNYWKGLFNSVLSDKNTNYFTKEGFFRFHDVGYFDKNGFLFVGGRSDDVINVAGHRISSSEIESICMEESNIKEACVVSCKDKMLGEKPILFISLNEKNKIQKEILKEKIRNLINIILTKYHLPDEIYVFDDLPKTKSGKIMRRIMKELVENYMLDKSKDYSTLSNYNKFKISENALFDNFISTNLTGDLIFYLPFFRDYLNISNSRILFDFILLIVEIVSRISKTKIIKLSIKLKNNKEEYFDFSFNFDNDSNLRDLSNKLGKSELSNESCMQDILMLLINIQNADGSILKVIQKEYQGKKEIYNINFIHQYCLQDDFPENFKGYFVKYNFINSNRNISLSSEKENKNYINSSNSYKFSCNKCKITLDEVKNLRGDKAKFVPIINASGESVYLCDLCFDGW